MKTFKRFHIAFCCILLVVFLNGVYYVFSGQFRSVEKLNAGKELNLYECCSVYTMHMAVWMFGWPISFHAATEAFLMHFPHTKPVTIEGYDMYAANGFSTEVRAKGADYGNMCLKELRVALALNSPNTYFEVTNAYSMCIVPVKYTNAVHQIWKIPVNTCLFVYLQEKHWLHPYEMVYYYMYV